jgi:bifunctional DNA-binding transcriptional regulator/antitoxin component of YhaV-PrlF toxin-antitoxin module
MSVETVPAPLRERLGPEATDGLLHLLELSHGEWRADVIAACAERFERRLVEEVAGLRVQIAQTDAVLRRDMSEMGPASVRG